MPICAVSCGDYPVASLVGTTGGGTTTETGTDTSTETGTDTGMTTGGLPDNDAPLPCGVLGDAGHECVSAHSTIRVIVPGYEGPLYQVDTGAATLDIGSKDGYADAAAQEAFCADGCTISIIYDQSGENNHLTPSPPGSNNPSPGAPVPAEKLPTQINGRSVYGILIRRGFGYRAACNDCVYPTDFPANHRVPVGDEPETVYMVTSGLDTNNGCCFDYGNAEITSKNDGNGTMEAVYIGGGVVWGYGSGEGPWVMADLENGLYAGWDENTKDWLYKPSTSVPFDFVTGVVVGDTADKNDGKGRMAIYAGDATVQDIKEMYDGIRPEKPGYVPMIKQGSIIMGIGGDASNLASGRFYEGALALGAATKETVKALQSAIYEAGYGK